MEGGTWSGRRHVRGGGFEIDCEKMNLAVLEGGAVLRFTTKQVVRGEAIEVIERALRARRAA